MYLREIQLGLPYMEKKEVISEVMIENNCTYEEALKIGYNKSWKSEVRRRFELETRCIAPMFIRLINKYKNNTCTKVVIDCVEKDFNKTYPIYNVTTINYSCFLVFWYMLHLPLVQSIDLFLYLLPQSSHCL